MTVPGFDRSSGLRFESGAPNLSSARQTRGALSSERLIHRSMSPVARGKPCAATAYAPTSMNSTFSSQNANNMSRKSEFSNWFSLEGPCVQSKLPHHLEALGGRRGSKIVVLIWFVKFEHSYFFRFDWYHRRVIIPLALSRAYAGTEHF